MTTSSDTGTPGTRLSVVPAPSEPSALVPMPQGPGGAGAGRWVWVDESHGWPDQRAQLAELGATPEFWWAVGRRRSWAGLDLPVTRDPIFWVWAFFMTATSITSIWFQPDTDKIVSILVVSWVGCTSIYWLVPALARRAWRSRKAHRLVLEVTDYPR